MIARRIPVHAAVPATEIMMAPPAEPRAIDARTPGATRGSARCRARRARCWRRSRGGTRASRPRWGSRGTPCSSSSRARPGDAARQYGTRGTTWTPSRSRTLSAAPDGSRPVRSRPRAAGWSATWPRRVCRRMAARKTVRSRRAGEDQPLADASPRDLARLALPQPHVDARPPRELEPEPPAAREHGARGQLTRRAGGPSTALIS